MRNTRTSEFHLSRTRTDSFVLDAAGRPIDIGSGRFAKVFLGEERWLDSLKEGLQDAEVELTTLLGNGSVTLQKLVDLKVGDVLPCDFSGKATVLAEGVPLFRGAFGVSRGQQCVRYESRIRRPGPSAADATLLRKTT